MQTLPLKILDYITNHLEVVRVSLTTAVQFISDAEKREDTASLTNRMEVVRDCSNNPTPHRVCSAAAWADYIIASAEDSPVRHYFDWCVMAAMAAARGEDPYDPEYWPEPSLFNRRWQ